MKYTVQQKQPLKPTKREHFHRSINYGCKRANVDHMKNWIQLNSITDSTTRNKTTGAVETSVNQNSKSE